MTSIDDTPEYQLATPRGFVPVLAAICTVVAIVSSVGAPLIPTVADAYSVSFTSAQWTLTITMLVGAVTVPVLGRLGDGPHRRPVIIGALSVVFIGCVLAAIPSNLALLLIGRGLQGVGLGLAPLAMAVARDHLTPFEAKRTVAALSVTAVAGIGLGYPLTGVIAHFWGYHACFVVASAASLAVLVGGITSVPSSRHVPHKPLDIVGAVLLGIGLTLLLIALTSGSYWGWTSFQTIGCAAVGLAVVVGWTFHELRTRFPLVELRLLSKPAVLTADVTGLFAGIGMFVLSSAVIRFVQTPSDTGYGLGRSAMVAGLVLVPFSLTSVFANRLLPLAERWISKSMIMPIGAMAFAGALTLFLFGRDELWVVFVLMGVAGLGIGFTFAAMPAFIVSAVPPHETGSALGVNQVARTVGGAVGSALSATVLAIYTAPGQTFPDSAGYTATAIVGIGLWTGTAILAFALSYRGSRAEKLPARLVDESIESAATGSFAYDIARRRGQSEDSR